MLHTKGPWFAVNYAGYNMLQSKDEYGEYDLLDEDKCPDAEANAKLAAAAPELLESLKEILLVLEMGMASPKDQKVFDNSKAVIAAKAAIKKTTE